MAELELPAEMLYVGLSDMVESIVTDKINQVKTNPSLSENTMTGMVHRVNYPKMSLYYHRYSDYIKAPVKLVLDIYLARGYVVNKVLVNEGDEIINEVYLPAAPSNGYSRDYIKERLFTPFTEGTIIFNDAYNTGSDMLGDHYLQYKTEKLSNCAQLENKKWYIKRIDQRADGSVHTGRFRIYPHKGHKCLADLMKWAQCYKFDTEVNGWVYDDNKRNHAIKFLKGSLKLKVADEVGDESERIADYSKLIYWLIGPNNPRLDVEQQELVRQLIPNREQLTKIFKRDLLVKQVIERILNEDLPDHYEFEL